MIRFENVTFAYEGKVKVIDAANGAIGPGLTLCLGLNGCGKSTFLKLAAGVEFPDGGRVLLNGRDLWKDEVEARRGLAYFPEHPDLTHYATISDILKLVGRLRGERPGREAEALRAAGLTDLANRSVRELSQGQRRRALFATVLVGEPEHVLLDEPLEAMDRRIKQEILGWIAARVEAGAAVVVVSHNLEPFAPLACRALTIDAGKLKTFEPLPSSPSDRLTLLECLAKGQPVPPQMA